MRLTDSLTIARLAVMAGTLALGGCGLIYDAVQWIYPIAKDDLQRICARKRLRVGISVEPFRPFVFPAVFTDEGVRITGMDVDLVRELASALGRRCGGEDPVVPTLQLVRVRDQFVALNENKVDLIVSAVTANVPLEQAAGIAYSIPYYDDGAIGGIARSREIALMVQERFTELTRTNEVQRPASRAFHGLRVAVPELRSPYVYAKDHLEVDDLILCDSFPAAFESQDPPVDVLLGKLPVLQYIATRVRKNWHLIEGGNGKPLRLMREQYAVAMAEENYRLRSFVNDVVFSLKESGRLEELRRKWHDEFYAYPRRAAAEGLPFSVEDLPQHYDQGTCR